MFIRIEMLGHYIELGAKEPEEQQAMVIDPGGQVIQVSSDSASSYVGFYGPDGGEEVEQDDTKRVVRKRQAPPRQP